MPPDNVKHKYPLTNSSQIGKIRELSHQLYRVLISARPQRSVQFGVIFGQILKNV
jgi:hypothetical protein